MTPHGRDNRSYLYLLLVIRISSFFFQTRCLLLKYLILELTILREVLHCASERGAFILLELAAMMLSTPPQVQPLGDVGRDISTFILCS